MYELQESKTTNVANQKLEQLAAELEVTVDYYLAEFFIVCDSCETAH